MHVDIGSLSSKGQFVIPRNFRDLLGLTAGTKMVIVSDGTHLLLTPIKAPHAKAYRKVIADAEKVRKRAETVSRKTGKRGRK